MEQHTTPDVKAMLQRVVDDVMDTVATFDGRFSFTPTNTSGFAKMSFHGFNGIQHLSIWTEVDEINHVQISLQFAEGTGEANRVVIYSGSFEEPAVRHNLGHHIAIWYGQSVKALDSR